MFKKALRMAGTIGVAASIALVPTQAFASGSSSHGSTHSYSAPKPAPKPAPRVTSGGRGVTAPKVKATSGSTSGRSVTAPKVTGNKAPAATSGKVTIPKTARASGSSYSDGGHTYTYSRSTYTTYYTTYHGGYPSYGTSLYWTLLNDPFYYPNYGNVFSPWYNHGYPAGYVVTNGEFIPVASSSGSAVGTVFLIILIIAATGLLVWFLLRRRGNGPRQYNRHFGDDI